MQYSTTSSVSAQRIANSNNWQTLWDVYLATGVEDNFTPINKPKTLEQLKDVAKVNKQGFHQEVEIGQMRLLSHHVLGDTIIPMFVLVLSKWDDEQWLVMPFSKFPVPSTSGEFLTGMEETDFSCLQAWNTRTCPNEALLCSWNSGTAPQNVIDDAFDLFRFTMIGEPELPKELEDRTGMPLTSILDVGRNIYQDESYEIFNPLSELSRELAEMERD